MRLWAYVLGVVAAMQVVEASRILFLGPVSSKSHKNFYMGILKPLADRGHQVTFLTPYAAAKAHKNIREVVVPDIQLSKHSPNLFAGRMSGPVSLLKRSPKLCSDALAKQESQNLLKEKYDVILLAMFFSDCFLSVVHEMKVPFIFVCPSALAGPFIKKAGGVSFPSFAPNLLLPYKHPYTFFVRMTAIITEIIGEVVFLHHLDGTVEKECRQRGLCRDDMPSFSEIRQNCSLTLVNGVKTIEVPAQPTVPTTIYCGGIHCHPSGPLPKDLEEWVAGAGEDGFIFFSLGSAVTPSDMPEEYRKVFIEVFGSLKQRVLWKWNKETMEDLPPNVRLGEWLPQQDILGDPRLRLFITHGGLLSTLESMYHGMSVLGTPVFADQHSNMEDVERNGWGKVLHWADLTPETLKEKILEVMNDKTLKEEAQRRSILMKDQPQRPEEVATYWVEYVLRHHGAPHLVSPVRSMPWYQLYNVDVWLTLLMVNVLSLYGVYKGVRALCRCIFSGKTKQKSE